MSNTEKKILACLDFSEYSTLVLEHAIKLANAYNRKILVLNVINQKELNALEKPFGIFPNSVTDGLSLKEIISKLKIDRNLKLKAMIEEHFPEERSLIAVKIDVGVPFDCILNTIDKESIAFVVMANKGRSNISKVLFGSAAEKVFRHSPVPVFSIRRKQSFNRTTN